jgi:hypothetical protein
MSTQAASGIGCQLKKGDGASPEVFTLVAEVLSIQGPTEKLDTHDVTNMDSPNFYREFIATLHDGGDVAFDVNYLPNSSGQLSLHTDFVARTKRNWSLVLPNDPTTSPLTSFGTWSFSAYIVEMGKDFPIDKQMTQKIKLKITGAPTYA